MMQNGVSARTGGVQPVDILWTRGRPERVNFSRADIIYGLAPSNESYYRYHMYQTIGTCLMKTTVVARAWKLAKLQKIDVKLKRYKLIWNSVKYFANSAVVMWEGGQVGTYSADCRSWGVHQHTLQSFKNMN